jgi:outer membrane protein TolC
MIFLSLLSVYFITQSAEALSLDEYLHLVKEKNLSYKSAELKKSGFEQSVRESDLFFRPVLQGQANIDSNAAFPNQPGFFYDEIKTNNYSLGVSQEFEFGLQMKLNYQLSKINFINAGFGSIPLVFENWNAIPQVEVQLPLWQNLFARSSRAERDLVKGQNKAEYEGALLQQTEVLINSQLAYYRLATAQMVVKLQKEAFTRSQEIFQFVQKKARLDLRDKSDVLQAKAALSANELDLKMALDEEKGAMRDFNRWRAEALDSAVPNLNPVQVSSFDRQALPQQRPGERLDVLIAQTQSHLMKATAIVAEERNKPNFSLVGTYALNGRNDTSLSSAISNANNSGRDSYSYGVRFSMPLHLGASMDARAGARLRQSAAEADLDYKKTDQDRQWTDLVVSYQDSLSRLDLLEQIVKAQQEKLREEKRLMRLGRSSLLNVLNFEQDYLRAERSRTQSIFETLSYRLQSQLYTGRIQ